MAGIASFILGLTLTVLPTANAQAELARLDSSQIRAALTGKIVRYSPPGWADADVHEEFRPDGKWGGIVYGRGPMGFAGRWDVRNDQLCVVAEQGLWAALRERVWYCRMVWRDPQTGRLLMDHVSGGYGNDRSMGPQTLIFIPPPA